ncbi:hypothetical protein N8I77_007003 [Diaporthe amygdali]|uniref:Uncharacterized protein n=1 Tax=Phomopsis amygdali TaxID=1214568 RepID=A0AAD9W0Z0_PHOAM|nr:hypothetical protein N8I77_007003 [Diaporthe amygdali]
MSSPDSIMDGLADLKLDRKPGADGDGAQQGDVGDPARMPLSAREFVIGASCALNMLQVHAEVGPDRQGLSCNSRSSRATGIPGKLSTCAEAMCRSTGEDLAVCLEMRSAYMAVSTQNESCGEKVPIREIRLGADEGELQPMSQTIEDLISVIIQMTRAEHGMSHELIPLENHIEALQRALQIPPGTDTANVNSPRLKLPAFSTLSHEFNRGNEEYGRFGEWAGLEREVWKMQATLLYISSMSTAWMHPVMTILQKVDTTDNFWDDSQLMRELREISHGLSKGLISIPDDGSEREGEYYKVPKDAKKASFRVRMAADRLEGKLAVWRRLKDQVQAWWDDLGYKEQEDFKSFLVQKGSADASKSTIYLRFLHLLFTSSRAVLLLCIERLSAVLVVAPWPDKITMKSYGDIRLRSLEALREACTAWYWLMRRKTTLGHWAKLASTLAGGQDATIILDDCSRIEHWFRKQWQTVLSMEEIKVILRGKPLKVAVIHNESDGDVREGQARKYAVLVLKSLVDEFDASGNPFSANARTMKNLSELVEMAEECANPTWWPQGEQTDPTLPIRAHCEAILCAHWVSRQNGCKKALKLAWFGGTRPLCGTCTSYIRTSLRQLGVDDDAFDDLVAGHHDAYWTCCMPAEAKEDVVQEVAEDLKM